MHLGIFSEVEHRKLNPHLLQGKKNTNLNSNIHICNPLIQLQLEYDRFLVPLRHESKKMPEKLRNKLIGISVESKCITGKEIDIYV